MKTDFIFDMETSDPDDVMTLCLLANHSKANLRAVTVTPGTDEQIGLVKQILRETGLNIPVGAFIPGHKEKILSDFYFQWIKFNPKQPDGKGYKIIEETLINYPDLTLLTGAPLNNLSKDKLEQLLSKAYYYGYFHRGWRETMLRIYKRKGIKLFLNPRNFLAMKDLLYFFRDIRRMGSHENSNSIQPIRFN